MKIVLLAGVGVLLLVLIGVLIWYSTTKENNTEKSIENVTEWQCLNINNKYNLPVRKNNENIECMSYDGTNCLWLFNITDTINCTNEINNSKNNSKKIIPLKCGKDHMRKYGETGYTNPNHWCSIGRENM